MELKFQDSVITKHFPDNRRILNELQRYSVSGNIDKGILGAVADVQLGALVTSLKEKDFAWCENGPHDYIIAFYETHPFFNCLRLRYPSTLLDDVGWYMICSPVGSVVEPWFEKVYKNYKRRQKRKASKQ